MLRSIIVAILLAGFGSAGYAEEIPVTTKDFAAICAGTEGGRDIRLASCNVWIDLLWSDTTLTSEEMSKLLSKAYEKRAQEYRHFGHSMNSFVIDDLYSAIGHDPNNMSA